MPEDQDSNSSKLSRRLMLGKAAATTAVLATTPALAQVCTIGPPKHEKGPLVWMDMDQIELDAAYDQNVYAPMIDQIQKRYATSSVTTRGRTGMPKRFAYGPTDIEALDLYQAKTANAPIFIFVHGGRWLRGAAKDYGFPADLFVNAGANYIAIDFIAVDAAKGDLRPMAEQVQRAIAWVYKNAASFRGDAKRLYIGGHSSGGHLCGVALVTDWQKDFGLPPDFISGALLMSGLYDMKVPRLSARSNYVKFDDDMEYAMSPLRQLDRMRTPLTVSYGTFESPEFQRQSCDFAAAVKKAGKQVELIEAPSFNHFEMCESLGNPYGPNGLAALRMMKLS